MFLLASYKEAEASEIRKKMVLHSLQLYFALQNNFILTFTEILGFLCRIAARRRATLCRNLRQNWIAHNSSRETITFPPLIPCMTSPIMHSVSVKERSESFKHWRKIYWTQQYLFSNWIKSQPKIFLARCGTFKGNQTSCRFKHILGSHREWKQQSPLHRGFGHDLCVSPHSVHVSVYHGRIYLWPNQTAQNIDKLIKVLPQNRNTWSLEYDLDTWKRGKK